MSIDKMHEVDRKFKNVVINRVFVADIYIKIDKDADEKFVFLIVHFYTNYSLHFSDMYKIN